MIFITPLIYANQGPDNCCRAHDLCPFKIRPLKTMFGLFNGRPHTSLHCVCDESFRSCLYRDGSQQSRLIGLFYFNQLLAPCFVVKKGQKCTQRTWWGKCKTFNHSALVGEWHQPPKFVMNWNVVMEKNIIFSWMIFLLTFIF